MRIKILLSLLLISAVAGCVSPAYYAPFTPEDGENRAVVLMDLTPTGDGSEHYFIAAINGQSPLLYPDKRVGKDSQGKIIKFYVLFEPGEYTLTCFYTRGRSMNNRPSTADVTKRVELKKGTIVTCRGTVQGQFATLWLEDDTGHRLTEPEEAIIKVTPPPIFIPPDDSDSS